MKSAPPFPAELIIAAGVALALSNQLLVAIVAAFLWIILRKLRPATRSEVLLVTSIVLSTAFIALLAAAFGWVASSLLLEIAVVTTVVVALYVSNRSAFAYLLILHASYVIIELAHALAAEEVSSMYWRSIIGAMAVQALIIWSLISYLRRQRSDVQPGREEVNDTEAGR